MSRSIEQTATDQRRQSSPTPANDPGDEADRLLLDRITVGDRDALRELYESHYHSLLHFMRRVTGQLELAKEGVNDVMLVVWRNGRSFSGRSKVSTWIMGIAYRKALKLLGRSRRWSSRLAAVDFDDWIERSEVPEETSDHGELRDLLEHAFRRLSPEHRAVVELTYFAGCSYQDIAEIAGCPVNTVKTRMFHARAHLRKLLPALAGHAEPGTEPGRGN
jgi:RNA polymerase sigma-70 factor (ECF subfamily)